MSNITELENARKEYEKYKYLYETYELLNHTFKVIINSIYGAFGNKYFRYFNLYNASAITTGGRLTIKGLTQYLKDTLGLEVIYNDTDSIFLHLGNFKLFKDKIKNIDNISEKIKIAKEIGENIISKEIKKYFELQSQICNTPKNTIKMDYENLGEKILIKTSKVYAMKIVDEDGKDIHDNPKYKIRGLEPVKSSTPKFFKKILKNYIIDILNNISENEINQKILNIKQEIFNDCKNLDYKNKNWKEHLNYILNKYSSKRRVSVLNKFENLINYNIYDDKNYNQYLNYMFNKINNIKNITQHARSSLYYNTIVKSHKKYNEFKKDNFDYISEGDLIFYVFTKSEKFNIDVFGWKSYIPFEFFYKYKIRLDPNKIFQIYLETPIKSIFEIIKFNKNTILYEKNKKSLF